MINVIKGIVNRFVINEVRLMLWNMMICMGISRSVIFSCRWMREIIVCNIGGSCYLG